LYLGRSVCLKSYKQDINYQNLGFYLTKASGLKTPLMPANHCIRSHLAPATAYYSFNGVKGFVKTQHVEFRY